MCDDEPPLRELVRAILGDGFVFAEATDGEEVLELARANPPDLVILDVMLPRRNGLDVLEEMRRDEELRDIPVVVVTAWTHSVDEALEKGAAGVLSKPFHPEELSGIVQELLGGP